MIKTVSETYSLYLQRMKAAQWKALGQAYEQLPEFKGWHDGSLSLGIG